MTTHYQHTEPDNPDPLAPAQGCFNAAIMGLFVDGALLLIGVLIWALFVR